MMVQLTLERSSKMAWMDNFISASDFDSIRWQTVTTF